MRGKHTAIGVYAQAPGLKECSDKGPLGKRELVVKIYSAEGEELWEREIRQEEFQLNK